MWQAMSMNKFRRPNSWHEHTDSAFDLFSWHSLPSDLCFEDLEHGIQEKRSATTCHGTLRAGKKAKIALVDCATSMRPALSQKTVGCDPPAAMATVCHEDSTRVCPPSPFYRQVSDEESETESLGDVHDPLLHQKIQLIDGHQDEFAPEPVFTNTHIITKMQLRVPAVTAPSQKQDTSDVTTSLNNLDCGSHPFEHKIEKCLGADFIPGDWDVVSRYLGSY